MFHFHQEQSDRKRMDPRNYGSPWLTQQLMNLDFDSLVVSGDDDVLNEGEGGREMRRNRERKNTNLLISVNLHIHSHENEINEAMEEDKLLGAHATCPHFLSLSHGIIVTD